MKKYFKILLFLLLVVFTTLFLHFITPLVLDGVWNYGFGYNIYLGLVPYKDYSMIIPPLFPCVVSIFIRLFGSKFIIYNLIISIIIVSISYISYMKIGWKAIIIYMLLLLYPHNGYNTFSVLLIFILLKVLEKDKDNYLLLAFIVSLMFFSKQTLFLLVIPSIMYSKNRKRTICLYLILIFSFLIYLIVNDNLYQFLDYCFFGMFDFASKNNTGINLLLFFEIGLCLFMLYKLIKSKFRDEAIFYILLFQVISFPIVDTSHFVLTVSPFVYYFYLNYNNKLSRYIFSVFFIFFILGFNYFIYNNYACVIYKNRDSVFNYKAITKDFLLYFDTIDKYTKEYSDYKLYLFDTRAYVGKLEFNMQINKYDLINDGNMGYHGSYKYLEEIKDYCRSNNCLFIVNAKEGMEDLNQSNKDIIKYVMNNYYNISSSGLENVYVNKM